MTLQPFFDAAPVVQVHAAAATVALLMGPAVLWRRRRDRLHKVGGYVWVTAMATAALTAFFIHSFAVIGPFSPIHLLAVLALGSLVVGMRAILRGDVVTHQRALRTLYLRGLLVAALFNFLPGRVVNRAVLPETPELGYWVIGIGLALMLGQAAWRALPARRQTITP